MERSVPLKVAGLLVVGEIRRLLDVFSEPSFDGSPYRGLGATVFQPGRISSHMQESPFHRLRIVLGKPEQRLHQMDRRKVDRAVVTGTRAVTVELRRPYDAEA